MASVAVTKMHGARNDFIVLDARAFRIEDLPALARTLCDRHAGIGADGLLVIEPADVADASMRVINADGSEAEMCGNGIRCVARFLDEAGQGGELRIQTVAGIISTRVIERGETYSVRVATSPPRIERRSGDDVFVTVGNPHVAKFRDSVDDLDLASEGRRMQSVIPGGINVHVVSVEGPHELRVRHYERGAGMTMACGTGAVASAVAAIDRGEASSPVLVHVPGGDLTIEWDGTDAFMTGPAVRVFDTTIRIPAPVHAG